MSGVKKIALKLLGGLFVVLAFIGAFLPLLPTTPFLLISAACFAKSSPRLHKKLLNNPIFGPLILNWQASRTIPKKAKCIALLMMFIALIYSCYLMRHSILLQILIVFLILFPMIYVFNIPNTKNDSLDEKKAP